MFLSLFALCSVLTSGSSSYAKCGERQPRGVAVNGLMGMCRWMGSHFHDWIDYNH